MKYENVKLGDYERVTETHVYFWGGIFSQWATTKFKDPKSKKTFCSTEQWMMWNKAKLFDESYCEKILKEKDPKKIKQMGRDINNFNIDVWDRFKYQIVVEGNYLKFSQNEYAKRILMESADRIFVEASPYDKIWGIGLYETDDRILDEKKSLGETLLGKAFTEVRDYFIRIDNV